MRWVVLVLGVCCLVLAGLLLGVYALVGGAISLSGSACGTESVSGVCPGSVFEFVFLIPAVVLLVVGAVAVVWVFVQIR